MFSKEMLFLAEFAFLNYSLEVISRTVLGKYELCCLMSSVGGNPIAPFILALWRWMCPALSRAGLETSRGPFPSEPLRDSLPAPRSVLTGAQVWKTSDTYFQGSDREKRGPKLLGMWVFRCQHSDQRSDSGFCWSVNLLRRAAIHSRAV